MYLSQCSFLIIVSFKNTCRRLRHFIILQILHFIAKVKKISAIEKTAILVVLVICPRFDKKATIVNFNSGKNKKIDQDIWTIILYKKIINSFTNQRFFFNQLILVYFLVHLINDELKDNEYFVF